MTCAYFGGIIKEWPQPFLNRRGQDTFQILKRSSAKVGVTRVQTLESDFQRLGG